MTRVQNAPLSWARQRFDHTMATLRCFLLSFTIPLTDRALAAVMLLGDRGAPIVTVDATRKCVGVSFRRRNMLVTSENDIRRLISGLAELCQDLDDVDKQSLRSLESILEVPSAIVLALAM